MPCDQVNTMSVEIHAADRNLLEVALKQLGLTYVRMEDGTVIIHTQDGPIRIEADRAVLKTALQPVLNQIKTQYAKVAVEEAATLYGWNFLEDEEEPGQYLLRKYD